MIESQVPHQDRPLFVVGSGRSGTTLLYHMLLVSGRFPIYHAESRILPAHHHYGPLDDAAARERFLADFLRSRQFARSGLGEAEVREAAQGVRGYADFLAEFMDRIAIAQGKERWAEKTPSHIEYMTCLSRRFPTGRFIHIVRDGRDVALSIRKLGWTARLGGDPFLQLLWAGKRWEYLLETARRQARGLPDRYLEIRYEDLLLERDLVLGQIAEFGEIPLDAEAVRRSEFGSLGRPNTAFGNSGGASPQEALFRWKRHPEKSEIERLTLALRATLSRFRYEVPAVSARIGERVSAGCRAGALGGMIRVKEWLRRNTPLGRRTGSPLEIGLD